MRLVDADAFERAVMFSDDEDLQDVIYRLRDFPAIEEPKWVEIYEGQENLPPLGVEVLLCVINGNEDVGYLTKDEEGLKWKVGTWYNDFLEWDAWRYLPEAWKGDYGE